MNKNSSNSFVTMTITTVSLMFTVLSVLPIIGPSFGAYALGLSVYRYKHQGFLHGHAVISMTIGELIFFIISSLIIRTIIEFYKPGLFWYIIIVGFISNYLFSIIFYFWGHYKAKAKKTWID